MRPNIPLVTPRLERALNLAKVEKRKKRDIVDTTFTHFGVLTPVAVKKGPFLPHGGRHRGESRSEMESKGR
jgi:hypothetical protein